MQKKNNNNNNKKQCCVSSLDWDYIIFVRNEWYKEFFSLNLSISQLEPFLASSIRAVLGLLKVR